eukprot:scaffold59092_cov50-Attheya_sp.AAC.1
MVGADSAVFLIVFVVVVVVVVVLPRRICLARDSPTVLLAHRTACWSYCGYCAKAWLTFTSHKATNQSNVMEVHFIVCLLIMRRRAKEWREVG